LDDTLVELVDTLAVYRVWAKSHSNDFEPLLALFAGKKKVFVAAARQAIGTLAPSQHVYAITGIDVVDAAGALQDEVKASFGYSASLRAFRWDPGVSAIDGNANCEASCAVSTPTIESNVFS